MRISTQTLQLEQILEYAPILLSETNLRRILNFTQECYLESRIARTKTSTLRYKGRKNLLSSQPHNTIRGYIDYRLMVLNVIVLWSKLVHLPYWNRSD